MRVDGSFLLASQSFFRSQKCIKLFNSILAKCLESDKSAFLRFYTVISQGFSVPVKNE